MKKQVAVLMGSKNDWPVMKKAADCLRDFKVDFEVRITSVHRTPQLLDDYLHADPAEVYICGAGGAAYLPGAVASRTLAPVIGVPISSSLHGQDALFSIVQMPTGTPVATMGIDRAANAAIMAIQILAMQDKKLHEALRHYREQFMKNAAAEEAALAKEFAS